MAQATRSHESGGATHDYDEPRASGVLLDSVRDVPCLPSRETSSVEGSPTRQMEGDAYLFGEASAMEFLADFELPDDLPMEIAMDALPHYDEPVYVGNDFPDRGQAEESQESERTDCKTLVVTATTTRVAKKNMPDASKVGGKSNNWRQERRLELLHLREEAMRLSAQLEQLKLAAGIQSTVPLTERVKLAGKACAQPRGIVKLGDSWQDAAVRESLARLVSGVENERLRKLLTLRMGHAHKLQQMVKRRMRSMVQARFECDSNTALSNERTALLVDPWQICFLQRMACRKYVERERTVFVAYTLSIAKEMSADRVPFEEVTWRTVQRGGEQAGGATTNLQTQILGTFPSYKFLSCLPPEAIDQWHDSLTSFNHTVEDVVIERERMKKETRVV
ncbi:hypothetical protein BBJ28_00014568 [Nothophytophthora sp. Chile5]|nr:hypothetical protein BBJ28_00014568 [Nothophytophthora sp. Chile5]